MFVDRETEMAALNALLKRPNAQFVVVYGRRRVGKTTLLVEWARRNSNRHQHFSTRTPLSAAR